MIASLGSIVVLLMLYIYIFVFEPYTFLTVFALFFLIGIVMIRLAKHYGRLILVLGLLNIAWVGNNLVFSYILKMPHIAPYVVSQIILILNAIGLIQLFFKAMFLAIMRVIKGLFTRSGPRVENNASAS